MKKLMTLLGVMAFALGAFALPSGTSFEGEEAMGAFALDAGDPDGTNPLERYWVSAEDSLDAYVTNSWKEATPYTGANRPAQFAGKANGSFLAIESSTKPLYRTVKDVSGKPLTSEATLALEAAQQAIGDGLYVDTLVQFTVSEGDSSGKDIDVNDGVKLAVWVESAGEDQPTNFVVRAGYMGETLVATNYVMTTPAGFDGDWSGWHRLTLKAIADIGTHSAGFVIFVDGEALMRFEPSSIGNIELSNVDSKFVGAVLPSLLARTQTNSDSLAAVGFSGTGNVDDISFTTTAPDFARDATVYTVSWNETVVGVTYDEAALVSGAQNQIPGASFELVVTYANGYVPGTPAAQDCEVTSTSASGNVVTYTVENATAGATIAFAGFVPAATVVIGNETFSFATLGEAFAAAKDAGGTITLFDDATLGDEDGVIYGEVPVTVVIDLHGNTITGPEGNPAFAVGENGTLVFTNSTETVGVVQAGVGDESYALILGGGAVKIYGGKFDGAIELDADGSLDDFLTIYGGMFRSEDWAGDLGGCLADPEIYVSDPVAGFVTVGGEAPVVATYTVTYYTNDVVYATATYTLNDESTFTPPAAPDVEGYDFGGWYTDNGTFETAFVFDETKDSDTDVYAKLTVKSMVIRIVKSDSSTEDYTSVADALEDAEDGDTLVLLADCSDDIELPTGVAFDTDEYEYSGDVTAADGNGYEVVQNGTVYAIVDNTASTWTGSVDSLWGTAGNWSTGLVPGQYTTVTFNNAADIGIGEGDDVRMVAGLVLNGNVSLHHNTRNYSYWPSVKICGGNVTGTGTLTLERCGFVGDGSGTINVACPVVFAGDSATSHDCFLQNGPIVFNGAVSSTLGRLHLQTPVTFNGAVTLENATITSAITDGQAPTFNGAVTLGAGASIYTYAFTYNDALTIGEGAVVSIGSSSQNYGENFTMTGSGRFIGNTVLPTGKAKEALTQSTWTGTFELLNKTVTDHWWISEYGNANSKVCFNNVTTYLYNDGNTGGSGNKNHMVAGIEVGSGGFKINGPYSKAYSWSLPALSGTGTFTVGIAGGTAGTHDKNVYLPADCSEFSGNIAFADDAANTRLVFGTTDREFKEKTICVGSDAVVGAGATWTASDEIYLDGIVKASAGTSLSTVVGSGKIVYGAKPTGTHVFGEGWSGIGALDYKGDSRIDLADYVNTIAQKCSCDTVEVVKGCSMQLDNFLGADVTPTLKVSGSVRINDGSSNNKRKISNLTGDGVLVFGGKGAMVNYAVDNVVGWNGVITNSASSTLVTNLVSGAGTVVYNVAASTTIGADFGGEVEYAVAPSAAPVVNAESEATVYLNFNYAGMNIAPYGNAKSTIKLGNLSADNAYLNDGSGSGTGRIPSKVIVAGDVTINNGWTQYPTGNWTGSKTLQFNDFTVDGSFALVTAQTTWNAAHCYYYIKSLNGDGAGSITVGAGYSLRIDAVDFVEAPSGDGCIVPLTVGPGSDVATAGELYGADGVLNGPIPVTVNGAATEQTLVYNAEKGGLVLYVEPEPSPAIDPSVPTELDVSPEATKEQAEEAAAAMDVAKTADASDVDQDVWNGYFTKTVEKVDDKWVATAALNPEAVLPVDDTVEEAKLTDMLESVTAAALDDETPAEVPTKAGLYYWIAGATEVGATTYTPGTAVLGDGTTQELEMPSLNAAGGKAFYKVCVGVEAPVAE